MTKITNAFATVDTVGIREDLSKDIYSVAPFETPFLNSIAKVKATNTLHEWQTDTLDTPSATNAQLEGDTYTAVAATATVRKQNYCQISDKRPAVTGTSMAVTHAGRTNPLEYEVVKKMRALKNDVEKAIMANKARVVRDNTTPGELGGMGAWFETNVSRGAGGSSGGSGTTASTNGTARTFTEALLKNVIQSIWTNGGNVDTIYVGGFNKQQFSTFTGNATRFDPTQSKKLTSSIDIYESDFGEIKVVPSRHVPLRSAYLVQTDMWAIAYLRDFGRTDIAKRGDAEEALLNVEYTLECRNEKSSGIVDDLTTS